MDVHASQVKINVALDTKRASPKHHLNNTFLGSFYVSLALNHLTHVVCHILALVPPRVVNLQMFA